MVAPYDPDAARPTTPPWPPSFAHPFGTDNFGRDVLSRVIHGTRVDLQMGIMGVICPFLLGTLLGSLAGYFGGASTP